MNPTAEMPASLFVVEAEKGAGLYPPELRLAVAATSRLLHGELLTAAEAAARPELLAACEVLFTGWGAPRFDAALLERMPRLRAVFSASGTIRGFVTPEFWARGIPIVSAASANAVPVAEFTLAAIIFGLKRVFSHAAAQRDGAPWRADPTMPGNYRSVVGLVSFGLIARRVRELLRALDMRVLVHDPFLSAEDAERHEVTRVSLEELFARSDAVSLHTPSLPETENMVRATHLAALRPGATFVNTARGRVVHEAELITFLERRPDVQAVLDVTHPEPPASNSPLRRLPNVVLTPHLAGSIGAECARMGELAVAEYGRWRDGLPLRHAIGREQLARMA